MGKLSRKKRLRRESGIAREPKPKLVRGSHHADACRCGAGIERGAKLCRYCVMKLQGAEDVKLARAALKECEERGAVPWEEVKSRLALHETARTS